MSPSSPIQPTPLPSLRVSRHHIRAHSGIPNTSIQNHPLLIYHSAFASGTTADVIETHLSSLGVVTPQWRYTMYRTKHFHSTSHEVLVVVAGRALCCFGGEGNEGRVQVGLKAGDVVIIPAGVGHVLLKDYDEEGGEAFLMVGSYPVGCGWDMCYGDGREGEEEKVEGIRGLGWFERDPVYGDQGPVLERGSG